MNSDIVLGSYISLVGLIVTFLAISLLILMMHLLRWIFPVKGEYRNESKMAIERSQEELEAKRGEETAVALAVGVSLLKQKETDSDQDPSLGKLLEP